jgi:hypothetical protein
MRAMRLGICEDAQNGFRGKSTRTSQSYAFHKLIIYCMDVQVYLISACMT